MDLSAVREGVQELVSDLEALHVKSLSVFGSVASGRASGKSDIDFLVEFNGPATFERYMDLKELLERRFAVRIDLVTMRALKPQLRDQVLNEAIKVA